MARMECRCGEVLSDGRVPNDVELWVYTDQEWSEIIDRDSIDPIQIPMPKYDVWRCPRCERVYIFNWSLDEKPIKVYVLEEKE